MISGLSGTVAEKLEKSVVVDVNGVRYEVQLSAPDLASLPTAGQPVDLWTRLVSSDSAMTLFGFSTKDEQRLFDLLTTVNGVGPRLALSVLGSNDVPTIVAAIKSEKTEQFTKISRLGKKIASRIVIDLKGKVEDAFPHVGASAASNIGARTIPQGDLALEALVELGYSEPQARAALADVNESEPGARVREALKILAPRTTTPDAALRS